MQTLPSKQPHVVVASHLTSLGAHTDVNLLATAGIDAFVINDTLATMDPRLAFGSGGALVQVAAEDAERARAVLRETRELHGGKPPFDILGDGMAKAGRCSNCGSDLLQKARLSVRDRSFAGPSSSSRTSPGSVAPRPRTRASSRDWCTAPDRSSDRRAACPAGPFRRTGCTPSSSPAGGSPCR